MAMSCPETATLPSSGSYILPVSSLSLEKGGVDTDIPSTGEYSELRILGHRFLGAYEMPVLGLHPVIWKVP